MPSLELKPVGESRDTGLEVLLSDSRLPASSERLPELDLALDDLWFGFPAIGTRTPPMPEGFGTKVKLTGGKEGV